LSAEVLTIDKISSCPLPLKQRTLGREASFSGKGLFTGEAAHLVLLPAPAGHGIVFKRLDCPGSPSLRATLEAVKATPRCTILGNDKIQVHTVEHLLSALRAMHVDNVLVTLTGPEIPIADGSAAPFVEMIKEAGVEDLEEERKVHLLSSPLFFSHGDVHLVALPAQEFRVSYTLHYPHSPIIGSQFYSFLLDEESYEREIAPSRTFCLYEEIAPLLEKGIIKGGGLDSAVILTEDRVLNPEGLRFSDEMVRHKILDLIGDFSLMEVPLLAHILAIRSGHSTNIAFAKLLLNQIKKRGSSR
jgi:UDP-3-O-[3-hydroxymyristoyl] N-acetylglucosamine deacetylase